MGEEKIYGMCPYMYSTVHCSKCAQIAIVHRSTLSSLDEWLVFEFVSLPR